MGPTPKSREPREPCLSSRHSKPSAPAPHAVLIPAQPGPYRPRPMTRSKELRRIETALEHQNEAELRWALAACALRSKHTKGHSHLWYRIEQRGAKPLYNLEKK